MKRRFISLALSVIMASSVIVSSSSVGEKSSLESLFSATPKDMTPVEQEYSLGLGDQMDALNYWLDFGWLSHTGMDITTTYEEALEIQRKIYNITNGTHQMPSVLGQDALRWGTAPYLVEDYTYPMGDGTPGSGYSKYQDYVVDSFEYNCDVSQILQPLLVGSHRDEAVSVEDMIPLSCYSLDKNGNKQIGWNDGGEHWYLLSLYNMYYSGYAQKEWQKMQDRWNFRTHIWYDALIPVPEGFYDNPNLTTAYGGIITNTAMEWEAVKTEILYAWENYALASSQEHVHPAYKGLSCYMLYPYGRVTDEDYMNTWGNSVMIGDRGGGSMNLVWGSELPKYEDRYFCINNRSADWNSFVTRFMENSLQYLYMMERKPLSYTNDASIHQVIFSGNLVSTYDKATGNYTLVEDGDFVIADGRDRFIPQAGAGCKIYVYSRGGNNRTWKLPDTWNGVTEADLYLLTLEDTPVKLETLDSSDGYVTVKAEAGTTYLLVPKGDSPTPSTANFNEIEEGKTLTSYQDLEFDVLDATTFKVYGGNARGGFGSPSIYVDSSDSKVITQIGMNEGAILHSFKVGNKGGEGRIVLHSSNPLNPDVMIELPKTDQVYKFNTEWVYGEIGEVTVLIENDKGVSNVLIDAIMYTTESSAGICASGVHGFETITIPAKCGAEGKTSDVCRFCGIEKNVTVIPAIPGTHDMTESEVILTATDYNTGLLAERCSKCDYVCETVIPRTSDKTNFALHTPFDCNYSDIPGVYPYSSGETTISFDITPIDITQKNILRGPCYFGIWLGEGYKTFIGYDFGKRGFVVADDNYEWFLHTVNNWTPLASSNYEWTKNEYGNYSTHHIEVKVNGDTATIYLDGTLMLSYTDPSVNSANDVVIFYTKGEYFADNFEITSSGTTLVKNDFDDGILPEWTRNSLLGEMPDVREFNPLEYFPDDHIHSNVLIATHKKTEYHDAYKEYECSECHSRIIIGIDLYGDANGDEKVNLTDVSTILKYIAKWDIEMNTYAADVNCDDKVNLTDVSMILKYIAKWDVVLGL